MKKILFVFLLIIILPINTSASFTIDEPNDTSAYYESTKYLKWVIDTNNNDRGRVVLWASLIRGDSGWSCVAGNSQKGNLPISYDLDFEQTFSGDTSVEWEIIAYLQNFWSISTMINDRATTFEDDGSYLCFDLRVFVIADYPQNFKLSDFTLFKVTDDTGDVEEGGIGGFIKNLPINDAWILSLFILVGIRKKNEKSK